MLKLSMELYLIHMNFEIKGIHHIELTVSNLAASTAFYGSLPGFQQVATYDDFIMFSVDSINIGLTTHAGKRQQDVFSEFNVGADHIAFRAIHETDLEKARRYFTEKGIPCSEIKTLENGTKLITFRDPDNIQLELAWKPVKQRRMRLRSGGTLQP